MIRMLGAMFIPNTSKITLFKLDPNKSNWTPNQPNNDKAIMTETAMEPYLPRANDDTSAVDKPVFAPTAQQRALKRDRRNVPIIDAIIASFKLIPLPSAPPKAVADKATIPAIQDR